MDKLDKYDDIDMENITINQHSYNINETIESWIRKICVSKDKNKKKEKKEEKMKYDYMKHLSQLSTTFPTKMEDEASVLSLSLNQNLTASPIRRRRKRESQYNQI